MWREFVAIETLPGWVPGLRKAQVIAKERGLPSEVHFEFADSFTYTLVYRYDVEQRTIEWEPKLGRRDGVTGFARFLPVEGGTEVVYAIEQGAGRDPQTRTLDDAKTLLAAFSQWMQRAR